MSDFTKEKNPTQDPVNLNAPTADDAFLAAFEGTRENDQAVIAKLKQELSQESAKTKELTECLEQAKKDNTSMGYRLEQALENMGKQARKIMDMKELHSREIRSYQRELNAASVKQLQSVAVPCMVIAIFAVLSLLTGMCVDRGWMVALLAELLICAFLCVVAFFGGIVWDRLKENKALRGSKNGDS